MGRLKIMLGIYDLAYVNDDDWNVMQIKLTRAGVEQIMLYFDPHK